MFALLIRGDTIVNGLIRIRAPWGLVRARTPLINQGEASRSPSDQSNFNRKNEDA
jgi:hypothetical protein